jgi:hypothetical protein
VTLVTADAFAGAELAQTLALPRYLERLAELEAEIVPSAIVVRFDGTRVLVRRLYRRVEREIAAAALVVSTPNLPEDWLVEPLEASGLRAAAIGDARAPRLMDTAIRDGFRAAFEAFRPEPARDVTVLAQAVG